MEKYRSKDFGNIYRLIYKEKQLSRQKIAEKLGISLPTVTNNLNQLKEEGLIYAAGTFNSTGGRKANIFECTPDARYSIGIDITKNHLSMVLINLKADIINKKRIRYAFEDTSDYYEYLHKEVTDFIKDTQIDNSRILGIGISLPVLIEKDQKTISYATVIKVSGNIHSKISAYFSYPILLFNDANSAGLAESWVTSPKTSQLYILLSGSVGGAWIQDGEIYTGNTWRASEFGHMRIVPNGKKCYCGSKGCLDAYCSANIFTDFTNGNLEKFFQELSTGNKGYRRIFNEYMDYLATAVINLRMCYDCDIILGGTVGAFMSEYLKDFRAKVAKLNPFEKNGDYIHSCHYKNEAAAVGAAIHYINSFIQSL